ncbi:MAG: hypothetical protein M3Q74_05140 [Pseudomonadota bacterium]|nr:hypothetical protein [Pseudomonadota bacterium]
MNKGMLVALWVLAAAGFACSLVIAYFAGAWAAWGAGGELRLTTVPPAVWVVLASVIVSALIGVRALRARSRSALPPVFIALSAPVLLLLGTLLPG